ncbi:MAG: YiiX/YebB-like N1pC/P60 family cysteine hydrolase [Candidatus Cryptobacteroides sp.]
MKMSRVRFESYFRGRILLTAFAVMACAAVACSCHHKGLRNADLVFVGEDGSDFSSAIADATADADGVRWVHVGMVEVVEDSIFVIEAEPRNGVRRIPMADFLKEQQSCAVRYMRLKVDFQPDKAIQRAKSRIGEPYDWYYLPDNGRCYCSELVYDSYLRKDGSHIFPSEPMSFRDADGNMPVFWTELFDALGCPVPEGEYGTNPDSMAESGLLVEVFP